MDCDPVIRPTPRPLDRLPGDSPWRGPIVQQVASSLAKTKTQQMPNTTLNGNPVAHLLPPECEYSYVYYIYILQEWKRRQDGCGLDGNLWVVVNPGSRNLGISESRGFQLSLGSAGPRQGDPWAANRFRHGFAAAALQTNSYIL